jgi:hypothetical protein
VPNAAPVVDRSDPSFGDALERVYGAGQTLIVRRIDLLVEELAAQGRSLLAASVTTVLGAAGALVGWIFVVAGVIDVLDPYVPRYVVEIAVGILHIGIGVTIIMAGRWRAAEEVSP